MAVQAPQRTEIKLIAAIVEKHPKVRFAASCTSAHADLYDRMEQALCERVANAVEGRPLRHQPRVSCPHRSKPRGCGGPGTLAEAGRPAPKTNAKDERFLPLNWQEALVFS